MAQIIHYVDQFLELGQEPQDICVISYYPAQVGLIRRTLFSADNPPFGLQVNTVDSCQGAQSEVVILSTVWGNRSD